jgi:uncharacterized coiled-coil DUF342 family protein
MQEPTNRELEALLVMTPEANARLSLALKRDKLNDELRRLGGQRRDCKDPGRLAELERKVSELKTKRDELSRSLEKPLSK